MIIIRNGVPDAEKIDTEWQNFIKHRYLTSDQLRVAKEALDRLCATFPAFVNCAANQEELSAYLVERKQLPLWETVRGAYLELVPTGRLFLDPSRVGIMRFGEDGIQSAYAVSQLTADELKQITTPSRPQNEQETINAMSADEYYRSEHGRALREERNRKADDAIREQQLREPEAAVQFFLAANRDYVRSDDNKTLMLGWLKERDLALTRNTLQQAYDSLKDRLELSFENNAEFGATRVIDYSDLAETVQLPATLQPIEVVERTKRITVQDLRKMSSTEYAAALANPTLAPQIEALLADQ